MTQEEILQQQKDAETERLRRKKEADNAILEQQKADLAAKNEVASKELDTTKTTNQGNLQYQSDKGQMQNSILDTYTGFGAGSTGAGIERQDERTRAGMSAIASLEDSYAKAKSKMTSDFNSDISNIDFAKSQNETGFNDSLSQLENSYKTSINTLRYNEAQVALKKKQDDDNARIEREKAARKYSFDFISGAIENNAKTDGGYDPVKVVQILNNARNNKFATDDVIAELEFKYSGGNADSVQPVSKVTNTSNSAREDNAKKLSANMDKLDSDRRYNTYDFMTKLHYGNALKTMEHDEIYYNMMSDKKAFTRDTLNMANEIVSRVANGEITQSTGQDLLDKYRISDDLGAMMSGGYLDEATAQNIYNTFKGVGLNA